jgi:hypothetical protein
MKAIRIEAFGNPSAAFGAVAQVVDAEQVAEAAAWSAVTPQAAGEVFNSKEQNMSNSSSKGTALITRASSGIGAVAGRLLREHSESMVPPGV